MDVKTSLARYVPVITKMVNPNDLGESISTIIASGIDHEFRTTCVKTIVDSQAVTEISRLISGANLYALQSVSTTNNQVLHPEYFLSSTLRFSASEMESFSKIAADFVKRVVIR
jgi:pyruvate formate lyase activating enzyme